MTGRGKGLQEDNIGKKRRKINRYVFLRGNYKKFALLYALTHLFSLGIFIIFGGGGLRGSTIERKTTKTDKESERATFKR